MTPDIASLADPHTGVLFTINGQSYVIGGTSVAAPIIAGFLATINCTQFINPLLYQAPYATCFHDIIRGSNGSYSATLIYDNCTGLGSINGQAMAEYILNPSIIVSGITLSTTTINLTPSQTSQITATVLPSNATNKSVTWTSSNSSAATVVNGLVTAIAVGSATITVSSTDGSNRSATALVTVTPVPIVPVSAITLNQTTASLYPTNTLTLTAFVTPSNATNKTVAWSSNSSNAMVNSSGVVTAVSAGSAIITARSVSGSQIATCAITITVPVTSVTISPITNTINTNATKQLSATVLPSNATNKAVTWTSSNSSIATVSSTGVVRGIASGSTTIRVQTVDRGFTATSNVTIVVGVQNVMLQTKSISLVRGATFQAIATIAPSNAQNKAVTWSSAISSVATVTNTGLITAVRNGTGIISVFTQDGNKSASIIVRVTTAVPSARLIQMT
jgi:uncharacterized protein YjdB